MCSDIVKSYSCSPFVGDAMHGIVCYHNAYSIGFGVITTAIRGRFWIMLILYHTSGFVSTLLLAAHVHPSRLDVRRIAKFSSLAFLPSHT